MGQKEAGLHIVDGTSPPSVGELRAALRRLLPSGWPRTEVPIRLAGEIQTSGALCDIIALLAQSGRSGTLVMACPEATRTLAIERGELVGAATTAPGERIGEVLYRSGEIAREDIDEAIMMSGIDGRFFGQTLVSLGRVEESVLEALLARQAEEIFYAAVRVEEGVFCFVDERLGVPLTASQRSPLISVLMEGARRMDEMLHFREVIGSSRHIPARTAREPGELGPELGAILDLCDGVRSIADVGREVGLLEFEVTQSFHTLATSGLVEILGPRVRGSIDVIVIYNDVLTFVHRRCDRLRCGDDLRRALERFVACSPELVGLLHDVTPEDDGSLDPGRVLRNAGSTRRDTVVRRALAAYVDFAVFHAGSLLPSSAAAELPGMIARLLQPLASADPLSTPIPSSVVPAATG